MINKKHVSFASEKPDKRKEMLDKFHDFQRKAEMYYVYHSIQRYTVSSFNVSHSNKSMLEEKYD